MPLLEKAIFELRVAMDAGHAPPIALVHVPSALRKTLPHLPTSHAAGAIEADSSGDGEMWPVETLPPLILRLRLPPSYPSRGAPVFGVRCSWLSCLLVLLEPPTSSLTRSGVS